MQRTLICVLLFALAASAQISAAVPVEFAAGLGMESRLVKEVNPDYASAQFTGQLYGKIRRWPLDLVIEWTPPEERNTASGDLSVTSITTALGFWGHYEFLPEPKRWSPFVSLGTGLYFDRVITNFNGDSDSRNSRRSFLGLGGGLTATLWNYLQIEGEVRGASIEERDEPMFSVLLRAGVQI